MTQPQPGIVPAACNINSMKRIKLPLLCLLLFTGSGIRAQQKTIPQKVDSVLKLMTLEEKIGQMNQYSGDWSHTGPITKDGDKQAQIRNGQIGSMLNVIGVQHTRELQEMAMQSRLKIPLLFGQDVIHGYRTTFPIPLAQASSWDLTAIENAERIAATEAAASGVHWTFSPMVDIARDARWGRVMEGSGEDTYLGSKIAAARVKGFQGKGIGQTDALISCVKHFAAYGAAIGGRDYNNVDMSERTLWEYYLPPFKAAVDAGAGSVMNAFNDINGVPATANAYLLRTILKGKWNFKGIVVSDWGSVGGVMRHGYAADDKEAAEKSVNAGCDMDMESRCFKNYLPSLVKEGKVKMQTIDEAVKRILTKKFELGLFADPFRFCNEEREKAQLNNPAFRKAARELSAKSIVLLKNENQLLPIKSEVKKIACIGPFVKAVRDNLGFWSMEWPDDSTTIVSQWDGLNQRFGKQSALSYAKGCNINDTDTSGFAEALQVALQSDLVIMSMGEARDMSGEAKSRSNIELPGVQEALIKAIHATGKPIVLLLNAGRPLVFKWSAENIPAIVYTWWLGSEAGNAIADVLSGDYNPSGKLPISFPRSTGQVPIYYNHLNTDHAAPNDSTLFYVSGYIDQLHSPQYVFGYGLSYANFQYGQLKLDKTSIRKKEKLKASITVTNTSNVDGEETVQLYIRDRSASLARPVKELKGFKKIIIPKNSTQTVEFTLSIEDLKFYNASLEYVAEPGIFDLMVGGNSSNLATVYFNLLP